MPNDRPTVNELILAYLKHARDYYRPNHGENKEAGCVNDVLAVLQEQGYGREPADAFRPRDLKKVREAMVAKDWSRTYINSQVNRVKRRFAYAVEEDLVPGSVYHALLAVKGLRKGTPGVRETKKVRPVPRDHIKPVLARAHAALRAMLLFAYRTGAWPGEVCALKPCHLDRTGKVWVYHVPPDANKTEHHDLERKVYIGPRGRKILEPWLEGISAEEYVFSPARAERLRQKARRDAPRPRFTPPTSGGWRPNGSVRRSARSGTTTPRPPSGARSSACARPPRYRAGRRTASATTRPRGSGGSTASRSPGSCWATGS